MKNNNDFWFISLCALLVISARVGLDIYMRIAIAANAVVVLADVARQVWRFVNGNKEAKN